MQEFLYALWTEPWWTYDSQAAGLWANLYRGFNLFEALCWFAFAILVFVRYVKHKKSAWEMLYAIAFLLFGLTDIREASVQTAPLVLVKGGILVVLFRLRHFLLQTCYNDNAWY